MTNNAKMIIGLVVLVIVLGVVYYAYKNQAPVIVQEQPALNPVSGQTVADKIPKTNPFETKVNPYDSYKNPFN